MFFFFLLVRISWVPLEKFFMIFIISYLCIHSSLSLYVLNTRTLICMQRSRDVVRALSGDTAASSSRTEKHPWCILSCIFLHGECLTCTTRSLVINCYTSILSFLGHVQLSKCSYSFFLSCLFFLVHDFAVHVIFEV